MLQNDIRGENENDGFIVPVAPITPGAGNSPTSPLSPRRNRLRGMSASIHIQGHDERGAEPFISYLHFLSRYWNHFPHSVTRILGACVTSPVWSISNWAGRSRFGFWRDPGGHQGLRKGNRRSAQVFRPGYLLVHWSPRNILPREGDRIRPFHRVHQAKTSTPGVRRRRPVSRIRVSSGGGSLNLPRTHHILKELRDVGWKEREKGKKVDFLSVR